MKTTKLVILSAIFVSGKMLKVGEGIEVNEREAQELIRRGVAKNPDLEGDDDGTKPLEEMKHAELLAYAKEMGIEVAQSASKAKIIELINASNEGEE